MVKKKIIVPLLLLCSMLFTVPVMASEPKAAFVYDDAELFTQSEADSISEKISDFSSETGWEIYAFTTEDAQGYTSQEYGENTFDQYATGMDGVAFVIDMDNREIAVVHFGEANRYYTDERVESILDEGFNYMGDAEYADAMEAMIDEAEYYYGQGVPSGQYNYDEETGEYDYYEKNTLTWFEILITLLVALGIGGAFCGITIGKYRLHFDKYKYDYHKNSHVNLTNRTDRFVNQVVTHRHIQRESSGGGGSSSGRTTVHTGAGGRSTGGGSRKF